ncbi:tRNA 2-thiouridine(34) synthase MnmA, partial [Candidatus Parcubacteria bacterium]|nr:tRNA 2-thiouridine(34) synthase MnmA [Candidatus Parcubacteria bacterium]
MAKVICAMSGGIDSSAAAALLKRAGFDVIGVFMKFWSEPSKDSLVGASNRCCSPEAELRARKVAKILKIPFYVFDFSKEFKKKVVDYFLKSLKMGETPNPCVICNKEIKFGILLKKALNLGLDYVATGHYARVKKVKNEFHLFSAQKFNLPVLDAKKSVEICFVRNTLNDFLKKYLKEKPGKIVDQDGKILGEHRGLWFYTIGQRKGLFLPKGPWWVLKKDLRKNLLIVTKKKEDLLKKDLICHKVNWIGKISKFPLEVLAKIRYQSDLAKAKVFPISN